MAKRKQPKKKTKKPKSKKRIKKKPSRRTSQAAGRLFPLNDLVKTLHVSERTLREWVKKGCPCTRRRKRGQKGGRASLFFDPGKVRQWMADNDVVPNGIGEEPPPPAPSSGTKDPDLPKAGIIGAIARLRAMERLAYAAFCQAIKNKESASRVRAKEKIYIEAHQALRRTEKEIPNILERRGEMIPLETVLEEQARIDLAIKNQMLTLPRKIAPELAVIVKNLFLTLLHELAPRLVMVRDAAGIEEIVQTKIDDVFAGVADAGEIEEILQNEIDDCLRHIASGDVLPGSPAGDVPAA